MAANSMANVFGVTGVPKPRERHQTWLKDVGFDQAPKYQERMGLVELDDFLTVAAPHLDFAKIVTSQVINSPPMWLKQKIDTYRSHDVEPYLDHSYFLTAYHSGVVDKAIVAGAAAGFEVIEFMNTWDDVSPRQWDEWRRIAAAQGMRVFFEFHPHHNWDLAEPKRASTADAILAAASPFLEAGAEKVMIDHDEFELQGDRAGEILQPVVDELGFERLVFEVASPKEGPDLWREFLAAYFSLFGPDCNVANIMPSQALFVETMR